jgi:RNA polymerase sigma factor for flagellar operon FliA
VSTNQDNDARSAADEADTARDRLILDHVPLLKHIVGRMSFDVPGGMDRDDLYGFGMIGLIAAADTWDESRWLKFSTYAYTRIRGAILDELRRMDFLPRGRRERVRELDRAVRVLEQQNGLPPSPEEVAAAMGITVEDVDVILLSAKTCNEASLDDDGFASQLGNLLSDPRSKDPVGSAEWNEMKQLLVDAIHALPEQEKVVITLYYGEELLLRDIAEVLGVTESRVSQIHSRALYRLNRSVLALIGSPE